MRKKIIVLLLLLGTVLGLGTRVHAAELPDENRTGSLVILTEYEGEPLDDGALTITRVGEIYIYDGNASFVLIDELSGKASLDKLDDPALAEKLEDLAQEQNLPTRSEEISDGRTEFQNLEPGLYLVTQREKDAPNGFAAIRPFLLSLPQWMNGSYVYDLMASPKVPLETEPTQPTEPPEPTEPQPGEPEIPQTGQLNWPIPVLAVLGLSLFCAGWILCFRSRREYYEA